MTIPAGELKHRLLIEHEVRVADAFGGMSNTWTTLGHCWAKATHTGAARDRFYRGETEHTEDVRFVVRYRQPFALDERKADRYRVVHRGRVYHVSTIVPSKLDRDYLEMSCVAWGATEEQMSVTPSSFTGLYDGSASYDGAQTYSGA